MELVDYKIRVNVVFFVVVDMFVYYGVFGGEDVVKEVLVGFNNFYFIGCNGMVGDVVKFIFFLLLEDFIWVIGIIFDVDGGVMVGRN